LIGFHKSFRDDELVQEWFGTLIGSMFTLFQVMTMDSYSGILRYTIDEVPESLILFGAFIGIASIVLMNLMTAIVVENAFAAAAKDEEAVAQLKKLKQKKSLNDLKILFKELDEDGSGALSKEEFTDVLDDPAFVQKMKALDIELDELPTIFDIFDDGDGQISTDEFCSGLMKMSGKALNRDMLTAVKKFRKCNRQIDELSDRMDDLAEPHKFFDNLDASHDKMLKIMSLTGDMIDIINKQGLVQTLKASKENFPEIPDTDTSAPPPSDDVIATYLQKLHRRKQGKEEIQQPTTRRSSKEGVEEAGKSSRSRSKRPGRKKKGARVSMDMSHNSSAAPIVVPPNLAEPWNRLGLDFHFRGPPPIPKRPTVMASPFRDDVEPPPSVLVFDSGPISSNPLAGMHHPNSIITTPREGDPNLTLRPSEAEEAQLARRGAFPQIRQIPGGKAGPNADGAVDLERQMNPLDVTASRHVDDLRGQVRQRGVPPV
jgi:hypothetical protein